MPRRRPSARPPRRLALAAGSLLLLLVAAVIVAILLSSSASQPSRGVVESIFQDDDYLLYSPTPAVIRTLNTLNTLRGLGVDRLRLTILWAAIAPDSASRVRPRHFDAADPAAYPPAAWGPYDRIVALARARGIDVAFNVTAPGPLWAMASPAPNLKVANHYRPAPQEFGKFVSALGRRYSGSYVPHPASGKGTGRLPRVNYWTIWNEVNQPGWLYPQWRFVAGQRVMNSPRLYRLYVDAAFGALRRTGHSPASDTILIGELAPEGSERTRDGDPIPPIPFIRALYCVDSAFRPLRGTAAALLHCPSGGSAQAFVRAHPALFEATGFAHHPYSFFLAPNVQMSDPNFAPLSDLSRLEGVLDRAVATYGVPRKLPIYLTEYGYESNPPNPFRGVSLRRQSLYLNEAQYLAWKDPRVRSLAQFLLYDSAPNAAYPPGSPGYWSTFQTGLLFQHGAHKPALNAYRLPIFVPHPSAAPGASLLVWGMLRPAPNASRQQALIQWRPVHGPYRTLTTVTTSDPSGFLTAHVQLPGTGALRLAWSAPGGQILHSRAVGVRRE
ncbi:MAG TPA: hypothetical protein VIM18_05220 [Solirubrobacteraceae bacterium]